MSKTMTNLGPRVAISAIVVLYLTVSLNSLVNAQENDYRENEHSLIIGSQCKFNSNNSIGNCVHFQLCPEAVREFCMHQIVPTTCSPINNNNPIVCCSGSSEVQPRPQLSAVQPSTDPRRKQGLSLKSDDRSSSPLIAKQSTDPGLEQNLLTSDAQPPALASAVPSSVASGSRQKLPRTSDIYCKKIYGEQLRFGGLAGGQRASKGQFPHMAALGWRYNGDTQWKCGGSLISEIFVLTAAHCTESNGLPPNIARIGDIQLINDNPELTFGIGAIINYPTYRKPLLYNDIALIKLTSRIEFDGNLRPACLHQDYNENDHFLVVGFGTTSFGGGTDENRLLFANLEVFPTDFCKNAFQQDETIPVGIQHNTQICAGDSKGIRDTCPGDSGGPLESSILRKMTVAYIYGITSFGRACATKTPGIYTRVMAYLDWIESIVWPGGQIFVPPSAKKFQ